MSRIAIAPIGAGHWDIAFSFNINTLECPDFCRDIACRDIAFLLNINALECPGLVGTLRDIALPGHCRDIRLLDFMTFTGLEGLIFGPLGKRFAGQIKFQTLTPFFLVGD